MLITGPILGQLILQSTSPVSHLVFEDDAYDMQSDHGQLLNGTTGCPSGKL